MRQSMITGLMIIVPLWITGQGEPINDNSNTNPTVVNYVNLERYTGTWYEIAKIPNRFQAKCAQNTTASYSLREDGRLNVINRCITEENEQISSHGIAKIVDTGSNAKLKVSFVQILGISLFWGDYWIIGLDDDYRYAIVGTPDRKYGWILAREPELAEETIDEIFLILQEQGYNPSDFEMTVHQG